MAGSGAGHSGYPRQRPVSPPCAEGDDHDGMRFQTNSTTMPATRGHCATAQDVCPSCDAAARFWVGRRDEAALLSTLPFDGRRRDMPATGCVQSLPTRLGSSDDGSTVMRQRSAAREGSGGRRLSLGRPARLWDSGLISSANNIDKENRRLGATPPARGASRGANFRVLDVPS